MSLSVYCLFEFNENYVMIVNKAERTPNALIKVILEALALLVFPYNYIVNF